MSATGNCRRRLQRAHLQGHLRPPAIKGKWRTSRLFVIEITELPCRVHGSNYRGRKSPIGPDEGERQQKLREMERETGIEPVTSSLGSWRSTAELLPLTCRLSRACWLLSISPLPLSLQLWSVLTAFAPAPTPFFPSRSSEKPPIVSPSKGAAKVGT